MVGILGWIVFGLIVGVIAKLLMPGRDPGGIIVTMLIGIVGAIFGGYIGRALGLYGPNQGAGILMSGMKDSHSSFDTHIDWGGLAHVAEFATHRHPALEHAKFGKRAYAGLYDVSPDDHAILGRAPGIEGLYLACGFSGHGFQHSPATGRLMAELLLEGRTSGIDITPLGIERFSTGALLREPLTAHAGTMSG